MATSAQDYRAAAEIISEALDKFTMTDRDDAIVVDMQVHDALEAVAVKLADRFGAENPRFDRERFMTACGFPYTSDPWEDQR